MHARPLRAGLIAIVATFAAAFAHAQSFPAKTLGLVIGVPPGGSNDTVARALAIPLRDGFTPAPMSPAEFDAMLRVKIEQIRKIVREANIKIT